MPETTDRERNEAGSAAAGQTRASADALTIVAGVADNSSDEDLRALLDGGVGELYAGWVPARWSRQLGYEVSPNRRYFRDRQVVDENRLAEIIAAARSAGARFLLALNEHTYAPAARDLLHGLAAQALEMGAGGFIVADPQLLTELRTRHPQTPDGAPLELVASCEAGVWSTAAARRWVEWGATRIIFPRELELVEMEAIAASTPTVGYEAFVAREYCPNSSAACFSTHGYGHRTHFCCNYEQRQLVSLPDGTEHDLPLAAAHGSSPEFLEALVALHRCGLCAVGRLAAAGVRYLKLPGRSTSARGALEILRRLLASEELTPTAARAAVGSPELCRGGLHCYYRLDDPPTDDWPDVESVGAWNGAAINLNSWGLTPSGVSALVGVEDEVFRDVRGWVRRGGAGVIAAADGGPGWRRDAAARCRGALEAAGFDLARPLAAAHLLLRGAGEAAESCPLHLPSASLLLDRVRALQDAGVAVTVVAPLLFQRDVPAVVGLFDDVFGALAAEERARLRLAVNDEGLLATAVRWPVALTTGRLFNRMKRDPYALAEPPPADVGEAGEVASRQSAALAHPHLTEPFHRERLRAAGVVAVGWDALPRPLASAPPADLEHEIYLPWAYVTSARPCPTVGAARAAEAFQDGVAAQTPPWPTRSCAQPCRDYAILQHHPWQHRAVVVRGNATYLDVSGELGTFLEGFERPYQVVLGV